MKLIIKYILLNLIVFGYMPANASVIIDSFEDAVMQRVDADGSDTVATSSAIGGFRTVEIADGSLGSTAIVFNGLYAHNGGALAPATSTLTWDANGSGLGNGSGIDLLATDTPSFIGSDCFECFVLDIFSIDQGDVDLTIGVTDTNNNSSSFTTSSATEILFEILFDNFTGVNLGLINSISLTVDGATGSDLVLNFHGYTGSEAQIGTPVPVAPTTWLLLAGLVGFFSSRKNNAFEFSVNSK